MRCNICKKKFKNNGDRDRERERDRDRERNFFYIWIAIDRNKNSIVGFKIGDRTKRTYKKLFEEINNKYTVNYVCTDKLKTYTSYRYESDKNTINDRYIPNNKQLSENLIKKYKSDKDNELKQFSIHIRSKTETCLIECVNNRIRHYLARFRRKSLCLSKSIEMLEYSLYLLFNKLYWKIV